MKPHLKGAREEANTWLEAFWATVAIFTGMFKSHQEPPEVEDSDK